MESLRNWIGIKPVKTDDTEMMYDAYNKNKDEFIKKSLPDLCQRFAINKGEQKSSFFIFHLQLTKKKRPLLLCRLLKFC